MREKKTFAKSFSVTEQTMEQLNQLVEKYNMLSPSEAVRRAVTEMHKSAFPDYIFKRSAKDVEKRSELEAKQKLDSMDPITFAEQNIGRLLVVQSEDNHRYIVVHGSANMLHAVKDDDIKKWYIDMPDMVQLHIRKAEKVSVASELNDYMIKYLQRNFGISAEALENFNHAETELEKESESNE